MNLKSSPTGTLWQVPGEEAGEEADEVRARFLGCLLGGAVGDALGAPVEFMSIEEIRVKFGRTGIRDYVPVYGRLGAITDDTQMTLFTADGLIRGWISGQSKGITSYPSVTAHAYLRWLLTQGDRSSCEVTPGSEGWLYGQQELHHSRAPGATCISALQQMRSLGDVARNNSKGCGGVMRVAPVGLFAWHWRHDEDAPSKAFGLASDLAAITHGHPTGQLAAGAIAVLVLGLVAGVGLESSGLVALTAADGDPIRRDSFPLACIDHICARRDSKWSAEPAVRWPDEPVPQRGLSDHFGLSISFTVNACVLLNHSSSADKNLTTGFDPKATTAF